MNTGLEQKNPDLTDDNVRHMLLLAERLKEQNGGELDDAAILAVSEATGATPEYVRLAVRLLPAQAKKQSAVQEVRSVFLTLEPDVRRNVIAVLLGTMCALMNVLATYTSGEAFFGAVYLIALGAGLWNLSISKDGRIAAFAGAFFGGTYFLASSLFVFLTSLFFKGYHFDQPASFLLIPYLLGGSIGGLILQKSASRFHKRLGIKDPAQERQELLRQLVQLQDKLRSGEQSMTFLCVDIVGSTKMKALADPLSVEFTFTEYHTFVETAAKRYGGKVHSTAGDGVTCAFEHPQQAFGAARNLQTGIVELNTFRNKIGVPIVLRAGLHTGSVNAPTPEDIKSLNFAHVIDIAAHLQKVCPPGGIAVSVASTKFMQGGESSIGMKRVQTDEVEAIIWEPKQRLLSLDPGLPPPAPGPTA